MVTPDNNSRRLRLVDDQTGPDPVTPAGELTAKQATAFAALVADGSQTAINYTLDQMNAE